MYYKEYYELTKSLTPSKYIVRCKDMKDVNNKNKYYRSLGYKVNDKNIAVNEINNLNNLYKTILFISNVILVLIYIIMNIALYIFAFIRRQEEFAILKLNGINNKMYFKVISLEIVDRIKYALIILWLLLIINKQYLYLFSIITLCFLLFNVLLIVMFMRLYEKLNIEKTLRD